jgi:seryl-tRNA synthetase
MISIQDLLNNTAAFAANLKNRNGNPELAQMAVDAYNSWKVSQNELDIIRQTKNQFNDKVITLQGEEKMLAINEMKVVAEKIKGLETETKELRENFDNLLKKIPSLTSQYTPIGKDDSENPVVQVWGDKPTFSFEPKQYWELPVYSKYVFQEDGVKAMGSRGFYMKGEIARFQKILFDYALDIIMSKGLELMYVPLMLNDKVLTGTGHLPDFDGQQYEVPFDENKTCYLISSSEPSIMGFFMDKNVGYLSKPELVTCWSSCFRKEAGSYGKDQQGILRVHQFEKVEMVAICKDQAQAEEYFAIFGKIEEEIYSSLGLCYRAVEVCTGDMPSKHWRQQDFEAWFPGADKFREICSNGNASDYQNRGLRISYKTDSGTNETPWGLNCSGITFRTGLAVMEQFQTEDGRVKIPAVLVDRFKKEFLE